jgi:hypothetical protein
VVRTIARSFAAAWFDRSPVEVSPQGDLTVPRIDIAMDCGPHVNPERVRAQMEGAVIMALTTMNYSEVTFKDGAAQEKNFDSYQMVRMDTAPREIHTHLIGGQDWSQPLGGVGEPGVPPVAPARLQRDFCGNGQADPVFAYQGSAQSLSVRRRCHGDASRAFAQIPSAMSPLQETQDALQE